MTKLVSRHLLLVVSTFALAPVFSGDVRPSSGTPRMACPSRHETIHRRTHLAGACRTGAATHVDFV